jgi:hypothetical protein
VTFHVPKHVLWALGFLVVAGAVAAAFLIGRSSGGEETSGAGTSEGSEPAGTSEPAAVEAPCTEEAAQRATLDSDFDDAIIETAAAQISANGHQPHSGAEIRVYPRTTAGITPQRLTPFVPESPPLHNQEVGGSSPPSSTNGWLFLARGAS